jgi:hypothetical protein
MTYDADLNIDLLDHLLSKQRRRQSSNQQMLPAIEMVIGDWYTDELGKVRHRMPGLNHGLGARIFRQSKRAALAWCCPGASLRTIGREALEGARICSSSICARAMKCFAIR